MNNNDERDFEEEAYNAWLLHGGDEPVHVLKQPDPDHTCEHLPGCDDDGWDHLGPCIVEDSTKED